MLMLLSTSGEAASDLSYLLHKHPAKVQAFALPFGQVHFFYPEVTRSRCTAAMLLDVDPVGLVRDRRGPSGAAGNASLMDQYVNDRPYVASSLLSVAIGRLLGSAMKGVCKDRPHLVAQVLPMEAMLAVLPARGGDGILRQLFEPLGYDIHVQRHVLDEAFPDWGPSPYYRLTLRHTLPLKDLLTHLYVLIPVLDREKHYWVGHDEVEKLLARGEGWLSRHPAKELIVDRYLKGFRSLTRDALARLSDEDAPDPDTQQVRAEQEEESIEHPLSLNEQRHAAVVEALTSSGAESVLDLGCAQGRLLKRLLEERQFTRIIGLDVSVRALELARDRLGLDRLADRQRQRVDLLHGSLLYRDGRLSGFDAACLVEVIEHFDPPRLAAAERTVFGSARPRVIVVTTPNVEYNTLFDRLPAGRFRHADHRFEWTREQFCRWAHWIAEKYGYGVRFAPIGPVHADFGSPTQMGVFART